MAEKKRKGINKWIIAAIVVVILILIIWGLSSMDFTAADLFGDDYSNRY